MYSPLGLKPPLANSGKPAYVPGTRVPVWAAAVVGVGVLAIIILAVVVMHHQPRTEITNGGGQFINAAGCGNRAGRGQAFIRTIRRMMGR